LRIGTDTCHTEQQASGSSQVLLLLLLRVVMQCRQQMVSQVLQEG
jgi:hypothetical protein